MASPLEVVSVHLKYRTRVLCEIQPYSRALKFKIRILNQNPSNLVLVVFVVIIVKIKVPYTEEKVRPQTVFWS